MANAAAKTAKRTIGAAQKAGKATANVAQKAGKATLGAAKKARKARINADDVTLKAADDVASPRMVPRPSSAIDESSTYGIDDPSDPPLSPEAALEARLEMEYKDLIEDVRKLTESNRHIALTEDVSNCLTPQLIYSKLDIQTNNHPFFKRVWIVRHKLDETSPLLSNAASDMVKANDGYWPEELNSHEKVREHIQFNEIMVTLNGTSNVSGTNVYSQKTYDFVDMNIGYRFANMLVQDPNTKQIGVDISLINDVLEQHGGGAEPFANVVVKDEYFLGSHFDEAAQKAKGFAFTAATHAGDIVGATSEKASDLANRAWSTAGNAVSYSKPSLDSRGVSASDENMAASPKKES